MPEKIDHIGIAVNSIENALTFYRDQLGLEMKEVEEVEEQKVKVAFLPVGESKIELLESTDPEGPVAKFIAARGEGFQHVALRVENLRDKLAELKAKGVRLIDDEPRRGAGGAQIAFIHPKSTGGILVELCQRSEK